MNRKISRKSIGRIIFIITGLAVGYSALPALWYILRLSDVTWLNFSVTDALLGAFIFYLLSFIFLDPILSVLRKAEKTLLTISPTKLLFGSLFLLVGLILANVIAIPLYRINVFVISTILPVVLMIVLGYLGFRIGITQTDDWRKLFKTRRGNDVENLIYDRKPDDNFHKFKILDTSVIIDGRIHDIVKTGFIEGVLLVPVFVVHELQLISDSSDSLKRARGRRGLDILNDMKNDPEVNIENYDGDFEDLTEVDGKLLKLAKIIDGIVVTNDFNLSKVSEFQNVPVLNINQLANTLKPAVLPGETMEVTVVKSGTERQQGVAYLEDGTMVVVEDGQYYLNKRVTVVITSALQTAAGRMIFARPQHAQRGIASDEKDKKEDNNSKK